jgi:hypothetical protein
MGAIEARCEVAVGQAEPVRRAQLYEPLVDGERVAGDPPVALLVDLPGEPVRAQVRIGRDMQAVDLTVVGGVRDDADAVAQDVLHAGRELCPAGAAGQQCDARHVQWSESGRPVTRMPAWTL